MLLTILFTEGEGIGFVAMRGKGDLQQTCNRFFEEVLGALRCSHAHCWTWPNLTKLYMPNRLNMIKLKRLTCPKFD